MEFTDHFNIQGMIIFQNFEKAFNMVQWSFLLKCLELFNFGPFFKNYVNTLYTNILKLVLQIMGMQALSLMPKEEYYKAALWVHICFLLVAEVLAIAIKENKRISGIKIYSKGHEITQLADDTTLSI